MLDKLKNTLRGKRDVKDRPPLKKRILSWAIQLAVVTAVIIGINECQSGGLISRNEPTPDFTLTSLDGITVTAGTLKGKPTVLYFFAPWCPVCDQTSRNVQALRRARTEKDLAIFAVGLEYENEDELRAFAAEHALTVPVLKGRRRTMTDFMVTAFPTIYILDDQGRVSSKTVGYTTEIGLRLRSL